MRTFLLVALGFVLCLVLGLGVPLYQTYKHPLGALTNHDYPLVQVTDERQGHQFALRKGESKLLPYGNYKITIPDAETSFVLFKNNRGVCNIQSANSILLVEVNENASVSREAK